MATSADITHEALEALSKKATQGVWEIAAYYTGTGPDEKCHGLVEVEDFPIGIIDEEGATVDSLSPNLEFIVTLVNAYRTGQLIHAMPSGDDVEAVDKAETCAESDLWGKPPDCDGIVVSSHGGGIRCSKCSGWFCY